MNRLKDLPNHVKWLTIIAAMICITYSFVYQPTSMSRLGYVYIITKWMPRTNIEYCCNVVIYLSYLTYQIQQQIDKYYENIQYD